MRFVFPLWFACVPQVEAVVVNEELKVLHEAAVNFECDIPEYWSVGKDIYRIMNLF